MDIVSTVSSKREEYVDLPIGAVFIRYADPELPAHNYNGRAFVKINKARAYELKNPAVYWLVPPSQHVNRVHITID